MFNNEYWAKQENNLWGAVDDLALAAVIAGGVRGVQLLPRAMQDFVPYETFHAFAMEYLRRYRLGTVRVISETTRRLLVPLLDDWMRSGDPLQVLEARMTPIFGSVRASRIAVTEVTRLFADGNIMAWHASGVVTSKVWRTANDELVCPLCGPLEGVTVELTKEFTQDAETVGNSKQMRLLLGDRYTPEMGQAKAQQFFRWQKAGVNAPPRHVNCRCSLHPVVSIEQYDNLPIPGVVPRIEDLGNGFGQVTR